MHICRSDGKPQFHDWPPSAHEVDKLVKDPHKKKGYNKLRDWWKTVKSEYVNKKNHQK